MTLLLALAYAAVAALLLNLGLASPWDPRLKAAAVVAVSLLYGGSYLGVRSLQGWPTSQSTPENFRVHWIAIDEPDKSSATDGAIYFWLRELDDGNLPTGEPRAHVLPFDAETAEAAREALEVLENGKQVNGRITLGILDPADEASPDAPRPLARGEGQLGGDEARLVFEFREVPPRPTYPRRRRSSPPRSPPRAPRPGRSPRAR